MSQEMCRSSHMKKISGLEEKLVRQAGMLEELVDKVLFVVIIHHMKTVIFCWNFLEVKHGTLQILISLHILIFIFMLFKVPLMVEKLNSKKLKGDDSKSMEEKVKVAETKLKEMQEESRAKEEDMHKVYDLVNR